MSALMKMLGVDKIMEGLDIDALTKQFENKMREDSRVAEDIKSIANDIAAIKVHLGIDGAYMITDITFTETEKGK